MLTAKINGTLSYNDLTEAILSATGKKAFSGIILSFGKELFLREDGSHKMIKIENNFGVPEGFHSLNLQQEKKPK